MKKILITGGAGFVGSHLAEQLSKNNNVVVMDNFITGSRDNISHLDVKIIEHDVAIPFNIIVDEIYNLACIASPVHYQANPIDTIRTSVYGAYNILELAKKTGAKVLQASTSEVYGDPMVHPQIETYWGNVNPIGLRACYDEGKRLAETLFMEYRKKVNIKIVRIFNTYGPRMADNDGRVIMNFINQATNNQDITIYGDGSQTRSFQYISDLINGLIRFMFTTATGPVNMGNPQEFTINELAEMVIRLTNSKSKLVHKPLPKDDPTRRKPDISLIKEMIEWEPIVDLETGLKLTIKSNDKITNRT